MHTKSDLVYLAPTVEDLEEIVKYHINQVGAALARQIYAAMTETIARLRQFPLKNYFERRETMTFAIIPLENSEMINHISREIIQCVLLN